MTSGDSTTSSTSSTGSSCASTVTFPVYMFSFAFLDAARFCIAASSDFLA